MTPPLSGTQMPRRSLLRSATTFALAGISAAATLSLTASRRRNTEAQIPLLSETVAFTHAGNFNLDAKPQASSTIQGVQRELWTPASAPLVPETRVREDAVGLESLVHATATYLDAARLPNTVDAELETAALLDLHVLTWALPSPVAGWNPNWRYTWPRDTAHVIVALYERGHTAWALDLLEKLAQMQRSDGTFHARYRPGTAEAPDQRLPQFDGVGWFAWAAARVLGKNSQGSAPAEAHGVTKATHPATAHSHAPPVPSVQLVHSLEAAALTLMTATNRRSHLPGASPDYWEKQEWSLPLSVAAITLAGLRGCAQLAQAGVIAGDAAALTQRAHEVDEGIARSFGARGYQRYSYGGGADAGLLMLLPPYSNVPAAGIGSTGRALTFVENACEAMARPAGGVAPANLWRRDGVSWTPQTAMFAQSFAHLGEHDAATDFLSWISEHRTRAGSISEKVLADGSPAAVAPLAWPAAVVLSTLAALPPQVDL